MAGLDNYEGIWKMQRKPEVVVSVSMTYIFTKPLSLNSHVQFVAEYSCPIRLREPGIYI
jgi:hypothetical protein